MAYVSSINPNAAEHFSDPRSVGGMLLKAGIITPAQAEEISVYREGRGIRFGEAAVELGMISPEALEDILAVQFAVPGRSGRRELHDDLVMVHRPRSRQAEEFRSLRNTLTMKWFRKSGIPPTLAVVSAQKGEGRSAVAANLAICFAQVGLRTLLIDADMRDPRQHSLFGLDDRYGLSGYLSGRVEEAAYYSVNGFNTLTVIPVGGLPPNPQELLLRPSLEELAKSAAENFEIVLFDTPAASEGTDYQIVAAAAKGAIVVTRERETRIGAATRMINSLEDIGVTVVGATMLAG
jgi:receptor protein-tyrosine kinase